MLRGRIRTEGLLGLVAAAVVVCVPPARSVEVRESHYVMGTLLEITLEAPDRNTGQGWIRDAVAVARRLDRQLTLYDDDSDLVRLNRSAGDGPVTVPESLFRILDLSKTFFRKSAGAFDVTFRPLLETWRNAREEGRVPSEEEIERALARVGSNRIRLEEPNRVALAKARMKVDLGGIGKGFAADRLATRLRESGVSEAFVSFGESTVLVIGPPEGKAPFEVWVRREGEAVGPVHLRDEALSTSRSYPADDEGGPDSMPHIVDPRSGRPVVPVRQATVVASDATSAEAWSTALVVAPDEVVRRVEDEPGLAAWVFDGERELRSAEISRYLGGS